MKACMFIDPGRFRHELRLQASVRVADGAGGYSESWQESATVFAQVEPAAARSRRAAEQDLEDVTHRVIMRRREGVEAGMRFVSGQRILVIRTVHDPDGTGRYLVALAREDVR